MAPHFRLPFVFNTLFTIFLLPSLVALVFGHGIDHVEAHRQMKTIRQTDADGVHAPVNGTTKPRLGNSTSGDAADLVAAALDALAVRNRLRLDNPRFNSYEVLPADIPSANKPTDDNTVPSILDFVDVASNSTLRKRALNSTGPISEEANPDGGYKYSVPAELVEAARILAESTPQHVSTGNQSDVASKIKAKYALKVNDTNAMPASFAMTEMSSILPVASNETIPLGSSGLKKRASKYWMANMQQLGSSPFAPSGYKVTIRALTTFGLALTGWNTGLERRARLRCKRFVFSFLFPGTCNSIIANTERFLGDGVTDDTGKSKPSSKYHCAFMLTPLFISCHQSRHL